MKYFDGYRRADGKTGTRNYILVIPSVGCSQGIARQIARNLRNTVYLPNILGCGQIGSDRAIVKKTLAGFGWHPNVSGVLVIGNGCEQLPADEIAREISATGRRTEVLVLQDVGSMRKTISLGRKIVKDMLSNASSLKREPVLLSKLVLGTECGGSDYTSGLASNPAVGVASDMLVKEGASIILSETPEIIGAEHLLAGRAQTKVIAQKILDAVAWWEAKAVEGGQDIRDANPSPGNIAGGITTLEEKSLGCIHKAGTTPIEEFITYADHPSRKGLVYMDTPAHDIEQLTGMVAGGAQIVVFTTGRGTPVGSPIAPVIKITANKNTYSVMRDCMDMDLSKITEGRETLQAAGRRVFDEIIAVASGKMTKAERLNQQDFCIFKTNMNI
ncbi:MAG TPA: UxaA family hydrolase [Syntrophorhabdaceae bacterium]|nr:UxaA family hydrolase [Syntrophorhabdaceae bacterium]